MLLDAPPAFPPLEQNSPDTSSWRAGQESVQLEQRIIRRFGTRGPACASRNRRSGPRLRGRSGPINGSLSGGPTTQSVLMKRLQTWMVRGPATDRSSLRSSAYVTIAVPSSAYPETLDDVLGQGRHDGSRIDDTLRCPHGGYWIPDRVPVRRMLGSAEFSSSMRTAISHISPPSVAQEATPQC